MAYIQGVSSRLPAFYDDNLRTTRSTHTKPVQSLPLVGSLEAAGYRSVAQGLVVEVVLSVARACPLEHGDVVSQLLDALHLLVEELALDEIGHLERRERSG